MKTYFRPLLPFVMPALVLVATLYLYGKWPVWTSQKEFAREFSALAIIFPYLPYFLFGTSLLLGWRFHQTGMLLCAWLFATAYWILHQGWCGTASGCLNTVLSLLFIEAALFSVWRWRRLPFIPTFFWIMVMMLQTATVACINTGMLKKVPDMWLRGIAASPLLTKIPAVFSQWRLSFPDFFQPVPVIFCCIGLYLLISGIRKHDVLAAGLLGALLSVFLGLGPMGPLFSITTSFFTAGCILVLAGLEASFFMAYRDELTGLPSRRALNQTLSGVRRRYTIAMIDVDHFKRFNDTYGHKTGDQVLKLLATKLNRMTGGAGSFRYGGEEFAAVFNGKSLKHALPHLDACRRRLSETPFVVRGKARKKASSAQRGRSGRKSGKQVRVTVSIGAAESSPSLKSPSQVIAAADKALYRAKKAGRNCVKT